MKSFPEIHTVLRANEARLQAKYPIQADLVSKRAIKPSYIPIIERDVVYV